MFLKFGFNNEKSIHTRVSFETSFDSKQPKLEPKLVSALSETKLLFRLFRFFTETEIFDVSIEPKQTEDQPKQFDREHILLFFLQKICLLLALHPRLAPDHPLPPPCFVLPTSQTPPQWEGGITACEILSYYRLWVGGFFAARGQLIDPWRLRPLFIPIPRRMTPHISTLP